MHTFVFIGEIVILGWKRAQQRHQKSERTAPELSSVGLHAHTDQQPVVLDNVCLLPAINNLSVTVNPGSWALLFGKDDFAKALFCDLCFSYIRPEKGQVPQAWKGSDVSFIGRTNTTYGDSLLDQLTSGVSHTRREHLLYVVKHVLSQRFHRHLSKDNPLEFRDNKKARELDLDERDFLEIAEANLILQRRKAVIVDTTTDFYKIALEQGYKHSDVFLGSRKTFFWIVDEDTGQLEGHCPWLQQKYQGVEKISLFFPSEFPSKYIN